MTNSTSDEREERLTDHDKTRFLERGFAVVENAGHSLRLIKRGDPRQAISIKWDDLPALRELITLALDDGPMVIGLDVSSQAAKNAATSMRSLCVEKVKAMRNEWAGNEFWVDAADEIITALESVTLEAATREDGDDG